MNKEKVFGENVIESITENIQHLRKLSKQLKIDNKVKRQLITELELSFVNVEEIGRVLKF